MTTATAPKVWPTTDDLDSIEKQLVEVSNSMDELHLTLFRYESQIDESDRYRPTLEQLGQLSRFIQLAGMDLDGMSRWLEEIKGAHHAAATTIPRRDEEGARDYYDDAR